MGRHIHAQFAGRGTSAKQLNYVYMLDQTSSKELGNPGKIAGRILVAEDDGDMRAYLYELLAERYQLTFVSNGQEALEWLDQTEADLIVSDLIMPVMDGLELLYSLREKKQNLTPVIFLTAHSEKLQVMQALRMGVDGYVTKPFEKDEFLARIATMLTNNQRRKTIYGNSSQTTLTYAQEPEHSFRARWLKELDVVIGKNIAGSHIKVSDLAFQMAESERTFRNRIKMYTGRSPHEYLTEARMNKARYLLENQVYLTVAEVANAVGLDHSSYFTKRFKERFGRTPSEFL